MDLIISLTLEEKKLLLDHCLDLTSTSQASHVKALFAHNEKASVIHARIQTALEPLNGLRPERCPKELAERTIRLLCEAAQRARVVRIQTT